jgi:hypothetical protein
MSHMKTLSIAQQPAPKGAEHLDMTGIAAITAKAYPKKGHEFYLCNPMDELIAAMYAGDRFVAHGVVAMQSKRVIIDPADIARIEEV